MSCGQFAEIKILAIDLGIKDTQKWYKSIKVVGNVEILGHVHTLDVLCLYSD